MPMVLAVPVEPPRALAETPAIDPGIAAPRTRSPRATAPGRWRGSAPLLDDPDLGLHARFVSALVAWRMGQLDGALQLLQECHATTRR